MKRNTRILPVPGRGARALRTLAMMAVCGLVWGAQAATYYVAKTGSDSNSGTSMAAPYLTIGRGISVLKPGDTLNVASGTYNERIPAINIAGTAVAPVTIQALSGNTPVIDGTGINLGNWTCLVQITGGAYITFQGFTIQNAAGASSNYGSLCIGNVSNSTIQNNLLINAAQGSGMWIQHSAAAPAFNKIIGNTTYGNRGGGFTMWQADSGYWLLQGNVAYNNAGSGNFDGFQIGGGDGGMHHVVVVNNVAHDNGNSDGPDNFDFGGHLENDHYLVQGNYAYGTTGGKFKLHSGDASLGVPSAYNAGVSGFHIARFNVISVPMDTYEFPNPHVMYNNTFVDCGQCLDIYWSSSELTTIGDGTYASWLAANPGATDTDMGRMTRKNNIVMNISSSANGSYMYTYNSSSVPMTYPNIRFQNTMYGASRSTIQWNGCTDVVPNSAAAFATFQNCGGPSKPETGSFVTTAAPSAIFTSYGASSPAMTNYQLAAGSPAIGRGTHLTKTMNACTVAANPGGCTTLILDRASYFMDGYCAGGQCVWTPDTIRIAGTTAVQIAPGGINDAANRVTLSSPVNWNLGDYVDLATLNPVPDIGAFQYGANATLSPPANVRVISVQ